MKKTEQKPHKMKLSLDSHKYVDQNILVFRNGLAGNTVPFFSAGLPEIQLIPSELSDKWYQLSS